MCAIGHCCREGTWPRSHKDLMWIVRRLANGLAVRAVSHHGYIILLPCSSPGQAKSISARPHKGPFTDAPRNTGLGPHKALFGEPRTKASQGPLERGLPWGRLWITSHAMPPAPRRFRDPRLCACEVAAEAGGPTQAVNGRIGFEGFRQEAVFYSSDLGVCVCMCFVAGLCLCSLLRSEVIQETAPLHHMARSEPAPSCLVDSLVDTDGSW